MTDALQQPEGGQGNALTGETNGQIKNDSATSNRAEIGHYAEELAGLLLEGMITAATAESLTGGGLAASLVTVAGISEVFQGAIVAYQNRIKAAMLAVPDDLLARVGSVAPSVAVAMAEGVAVRLGARFALATTGVAGPEAHDGKAVGTVYIAAYFEGCVSIAEHHFCGGRHDIRQASIKAALRLGSSLVRERMAGVAVVAPRAINEQK